MVVLGGGATLNARPSHALLPPSDVRPVLTREQADSGPERAPLGNCRFASLKSPHSPMCTILDRVHPRHMTRTPPGAIDSVNHFFQIFRPNPQIKVPPCFTLTRGMTAEEEGARRGIASARAWARARTRERDGDPCTEWSPPPPPPICLPGRGGEAAAIPRRAPSSSAVWPRALAATTTMPDTFWCGGWGSRAPPFPRSPREKLQSRLDPKSSARIPPD